MVAGGDALLAPGITRRLIAEFARRPDPSAVAPAALDALTDREREVLALVAHGLSNAEIAEQLVVSSATSKTYVSRLLAKLGARDRAQLVAIAYETGLVTPGAGWPSTPGGDGGRAGRRRRDGGWAELVPLSRGLRDGRCRPPTGSCDRRELT